MKLHLIAAVLFATIAQSTSRSEDFSLHTFERQRLSEVYFSEGANAGDINGDGKMDVVYGPYWYEGPAFEKKREIYAAKPQNMEGYADNFFNWIYDFNGDGWNDIFVVGFPGKPGYVYENPKGDFTKHWPKHQVFVDGRIELHPTEVWFDYLQVIFPSASWRQLFDKYDISYAVLDRAEEADLVADLRADRAWRLDYEDDQAVVLTRVDH